MSRYVDADVLKKRMLAVFEDDEIGVVLNGYWSSKLVREIIDEQPTSDVSPLVHGEWIMLNPSLAKCSVCGGYESTNGKDLTMKGIIFKEMKRYCPHCGARMDLQ